MKPPLLRRTVTLTHIDTLVVWHFAQPAMLPMHGLSIKECLALLSILFRMHFVLPHQHSRS